MAEPFGPPIGTALWWLNRLEGELYARQADLRQMESYYVGNHPLPFLTQAHSAKMVDEFRKLIEDSRSNFCRLVVDATEERLSVEGFRLSARADAEADQASWDIWQANQMDAEAPAAILDALVKGYSYLSVWEGERDGDYPTIAVEDPLETIVAYTPGSNYRQRDAALKVWEDSNSGVRRANVYLSDGIYKFYAKRDEPTRDRIGTRAAQLASSSDRITRWVPLAGDVTFAGEAFVPNRLGIVPIIPLRNRPRIRCEGESELRDVFRVQNQINGFLFLLALAGYFGAHRQRWAAGIPIMRDDKGNAVEPFDSAIDKLWTAENPDVKFGEFSQTDLAGYINAIEQKILHIAVTTRTPRHYLIEQGQSPSGDAIRSAESGLVKKVERKQRPFGEGFEEAIRLARLFQGEEDAPVDSEIIWGDANTPTVGEVTDAVIKSFQAGLVTWPQAMADLGYTATQIERMAQERADDALLAGLTNPTPPPIAPPAVPVTPAPQV